MTASIYGLCHPITGELRYIGKANKPAARLKSHGKDADRQRTPVHCWITKLFGLGGPEMVILEEGCEDWVSAERRWIAKARAAGFRLLNLADGGNQPHCSAEVRSANGKRLMQYMRGELAPEHYAMTLEEREAYVLPTLFEITSRRKDPESQIKAMRALQRMREVYRTNPRKFKKLKKFNGPPN